MIDVRFGPQVCGDLAVGAAREWLVTDGCGGYAMGTVSGLRTRRYHGLLVVAGDTPAVRRVGLVSLDPVLTLPSGAPVRLGTHEWASGAIDPAGYQLLETFDLIDGLPRWRWRIGALVVERELAMTYGRSGVAIVHRLICGGPARLSLAAICTWRDAHGERRADGPPPHVEPAASGAIVAGAFRLAGPGWQPHGRWWHGAHHREEAARGLNPDEDLWYAGDFAGPLERPGDSVSTLAWAGDLPARPPDATEVITAARRRSRAVVAAARGGDDVDATLALAADTFVVGAGPGGPGTTAPGRPGGPDIIAGYPWFGVWSRDTMIAYEGLFLCTGRADEGRELLRAYAATLSAGMLANTADTGHVEYNTADATLWFLHAVGRHVAATDDEDLAAEVLPALYGVIDAHLRGTRYGIRVVPDDGLLTQGVPASPAAALQPELMNPALTWMDARVNGVPVTPRAGKAVEVNSLWINGLAVVRELAGRLSRDAGAIPAAHARAVESFRRRFPTPGGWLYDVVDAPTPAYPLDDAVDAPDAAVVFGPDSVDDDLLRPNQLLAWSLPYAPLEPDAEVLRTIATALLTPLGPRSLAPGSPGFRGHHRGGPAERDAAYHQGTVWPWLIGPYADACRRAGLDVSNLFTGLESHLSEHGLGSVSETAAASAPHAATGCPFQAWSVAELLRVRRDR